MASSVAILAQGFQALGISNLFSCEHLLKPVLTLETSLGLGTMGTSARDDSGPIARGIGHSDQAVRLHRRVVLNAPGRQPGGSQGSCGDATTSSREGYFAVTGVQEGLIGLCQGGQQNCRDYIRCLVYARVKGDEVPKKSIVSTDSYKIASGQEVADFIFGGMKRANGVGSWIEANSGGAPDSN
eukprot:6457002-Amphidinium_carterae.1